MTAFPYGIMGPTAAVMYVLMVIVYVVFLHLIIAAQMIGLWFTFRKMGLPGWKGLIPFYNVYVLCETLWEVKYFWRMIVFSIISAVTLITGEVLMSVWDHIAARGVMVGYGVVAAALSSLVVAFVMLVLAIVLTFRIYHKLVRGFGLKTAWVWGILFVPYIMFPIIGFNKNIVYLQPVKDE